LPAGKEPRNFGLHRVKQLAGIPEVTDIIQLAPATRPPADRTWVLLTEAPKDGWAWAVTRTPSAWLSGAT
jgi:hypothetical protein